MNVNQYNPFSFLLLTILLMGFLTVSGCNDVTNLPDSSADKDEKPPAVESSNPSDRSYDISIDSEVTVTFSEKIDEGSLNLSFYNPATKAMVHGKANVSANTLTFTPDEPLEINSSYEFFVFEAEDLAGNSLEEVYSIIFHTQDFHTED